MSQKKDVVFVTVRNFSSRLPNKEINFGRQKDFLVNQTKFNERIK